MNPNYEQQKDEIELLRNILFEKMNMITEEPNYHFEITVKPDNSDHPKLNFQIDVFLPDGYPNVAPKVEVNDLSNYLPSSKVKSLIDSVREIQVELLDMPMVYQIYELVQTFANEQEEQINSEFQQKIMAEEEKKRIEKKKKDDEIALLETKEYTPVTRELFEAWFNKFYSVKLKSKCKVEIEQDSRQTGREYFMNLKNKQMEVEEDDVQDEKMEGSNINSENNKEYFDAEAFCEEIDNIDFDIDDFDN